jgi:hypothetical protein
MDQDQQHSNNQAAQLGRRGHMVATRGVMVLRTQSVDRRSTTYGQMLGPDEK